MKERKGYWVLLNKLGAVTFRNTKQLEEYTNLLDKENIPYYCIFVSESHFRGGNHDN